MANWIEVILRAIGMLMLLFFAAKLAGKKQVAQLSYFDYISRITLGGIAAITILHLEVNFYYGILAVVVWVGITYLLDLLALKSKVVRAFIDGKSTVLIKDGKVMEDNLKKEQFTTDMLLKQLRTKNAFKFADVEFAVLEPTGELNVLLKRDRQPLTLKDLNVKIPDEKEPQAVIMDGKILNEPLATLGLNQAWLKTELDKQGVAIENVFLGQVDSFGQLTVDLFDDKIQVPKPTEMPLLLSSIKKCQADLELFALATENEKAKQMYSKNAKKVEEVIRKVQTLLQ
ncbi:DUF421 domain-containing protein [Schinkia azotoformans]|uniref:DUF421 domain-containing protein n=1 Tax=Schinkia azotoformans LMG 9581 TaxID=1131731 RepID=K6DRA1_SCHAZ|nr:DUF421 domain-containing protein [Schinkia azotoformans]EKN63316.1 hypothetical protein BAZO_16629 [Schinkia azotoformans LMG 9581]MEC1640398.1 DUF421 domain-containing protein [Schinkia azotoformans]MEC1946582.1 DUF421 domain-containing protein [Schinkia azotoformans]